MSQPESFAAALELLVIQGSPFCNLNCRYCYLPDRQNKARMKLEVLEASLRNVLSSRMVGERLTLVWHAGEPLALPRSFYESAFAMVEQVNREVTRGTVEITHSIQTNATTLDDAWCAFLREHRVRVGVSIDGPQHLHDLNRVDWKGKGTHARVMRGIECLRRNRIEFHAIAVVSSAAMAAPDEFFEFFASHGIASLGLNVEEQEGANRESHIEGALAVAKYRAFLQRLFQRNREAGFPLRVREFDGMAGAIRFASGVERCQDNQAFRILSVDFEGNVATWSPELLGQTTDRYGTMTLGNLTRDRLDDLPDSPQFLRIHADIEAGVAECRRNCEYFLVCGGGCPSNKLAESGSLAATATAHCTLTKKAVADVVLAEFEKFLQPA